MSDAAHSTERATTVQPSADFRVMPVHAEDVRTLAAITAATRKIAVIVLFISKNIYCCISLLAVTIIKGFISSYGMTKVGRPLA